MHRQKFWHFEAFVFLCSSLCLPSLGNHCNDDNSLYIILFYIYDGANLGRLLWKLIFRGKFHNMIDRSSLMRAVQILFCFPHPEYSYSFLRGVCLYLTFIPLHKTMHAQCTTKHAMQNVSWHWYFVGDECTGLPGWSWLEAGHSINSSTVQQCKMFLACIVTEKFKKKYM